ncbi:uncharacterized protein G2W53_032890 [Senna tora]|uniref:Uncharacterized protein n=1 Tax=Senna tora TaxID=362788 RepID=A0A834SXH5_9FABA|nr:uncharacterized protein G2W53_032890 [Senna tora]
MGVRLTARTVVLWWWAEAHGGIVVRGWGHGGGFC